MIFIAGASGGVGRYIYDNTTDRIGTFFSKPYKDTIYYDFSQDANIIEGLARRIDFVISTISLTDVDYSEQNPQRSLEITFNTIKNITNICAKYKIPLVYISTNDLFMGDKGLYTEKDIPFAINQYCKDKLLTEVYIRNICEKYLILRCSILEPYSSFKKEPLIVTIFKNIKSGQKCNLFYDSFNSPVHVSTISKFCLNRELHTGRLLHLYSERVSKVQLGEVASEIVGKPININKISIDDIKFIAKRPKDVSLSSIYNIDNQVDIEGEILKIYLELKNEIVF